MTPAEHYAEAERLEEAAADIYNQQADKLQQGIVTGQIPPEVVSVCIAVPSYLVARALVHATLALAPAGGYPLPSRLKRRTPAPTTEDRPWVAPEDCGCGVGASCRHTRGGGS